MSVNAPLEVVEQQQEVDSIISTKDVEVNGVWYEEVVIQFTDHEVAAVNQDHEHLDHLCTKLKQFGFVCMTPVRDGDFDGFLHFRRTLDDEYQF
jgi:hypothetical protein